MPHQTPTAGAYPGFTLLDLASPQAEDMNDKAVKIAKARRAQAAA